MGEISDEQLWSWVDRDAPELDRHLAAHPEDAPRVADLRAAMGRVATASARPAPPDRIGDFRIVRRLGEGGMGVVFEARQPEPDRAVALKVLRPLTSDERALRWFRREAGALAKLSHPAIATVYAAGSTALDEHWIAMELVPGDPLHVHLQHADAPTRWKVAYAAEVCDALEHAHARGVLHRDLKPSNLMVTPEGRAKVLDFGLARLAGTDRSLHSVSAAGSGLVGTLPYMSPEQLGGDADRLDARSDVYSMGVVLYEMLTGRLPHEVADAPIGRAVRAVLDDDVAPPSRYDKRLRGDLDAVLLKALAKSPRKRYRSAADFADDLRRHLDGRAVRARRLRPGYRVRRFLWRRRAALALLLFAAALAVPVARFVQPFSWEWGRLYGSDLLPEAVPYDDLRWRAHRAQVLVDGEWYELRAIDGVNTGLIIEYAKQTAGDSWCKRFSEDLPTVLMGLGERALWSAELELADLETGAVTRVSRRLDRDARNRIRDGRNRAPFAGARVTDGALEVRVDDEWIRPTRIAGADLDAWTAAAAALDAPWPDALRTGFHDLCVEATGDSPGEVVAVSTADGAREVALRDDDAFHATVRAALADREPRR